MSILVPRQAKSLMIASHVLGHSARALGVRSIYKLSKEVNTVRIENQEFVSSVRHYANAPAKSEEQDPLKTIFFNMMNKYKTMISELTKSKITLDPDDDKAVSEYKDLMDGARKKVGLPSRTEKIAIWIDREAAAAPDVKSFFKVLPKLKARLGVKEEYEGDKLMIEAVEKVEEKIGRALIRGDKEGMSLLSKEFDAINKSLGINPNSLKNLEGQLDTIFAKAELQHMKNEVVHTIETHKKRHGLEEIQVDLRKLDHRNYL